MVALGPSQNIIGQISPVVNRTPPPEGSKAVAMDATVNSQNFNGQTFSYQIGAQTLSQVVSIEIDNSQNSQPLTLIHGAVLQTTIIPAGGGAIVPTTSNQGTYNFSVSTPDAPASPIDIGITLYNYSIQPAIWSIAVSQSGFWTVNVGNFPSGFNVDNFPASFGASQSGAWNVGVNNFPASFGASQSGAWNVTLTASPIAPANMANGQVTVTTTAAQLVAARASAVQRTVINAGATTAYIGPTIGVTSGSGTPIPAGAVVSIQTQSAIFAVTASGSTTLGIIETF